MYMLFDFIRVHYDTLDSIALRLLRNVFNSQRRAEFIDAVREYMPEKERSCIVMLASTFTPFALVQTVI
jgi:hypothetical protein